MAFPDDASHIPGGAELSKGRGLRGPRQIASPQRSVGVEYRGPRQEGVKAMLDHHGQGSFTIQRHARYLSGSSLIKNLDGSSLPSRGGHCVRVPYETALLSPLWRETLEPPAALAVTAEAQPVVQPAGAALPELYRVGVEAIASPVRGPRYFRSLVARRKLLHPCLEDLPAADDRALL